MKHFLPLLVLSCWCVFPVYGGLPTTYEEFTRVPQAEREDLVTDESSPAHLKRLNWWIRLRDGEEAWQVKQQDRIASNNHYYDLINVFNHYQHLRESFLSQDWQRKKAVGIPPKDRDRESTQIKAEEEATSRIYIDGVAILAALAPTPTTRAFNEKTGLLSDDWQKSYPDGTDWVITRQDMDRINAQMQEFRAELATLPKLSPKEVQAAIDALPDEEPSGVVVGYPSRRK